ncbi:MAG: hypothetical protein IJZ03_08690 [Clostridia bacterium]|nr:hypothetical protein [Clostridia bacterium]
MKKLLAILILLSMILAFTVSCRSSDKNNKENKQDAENNEKVEVKEDPEPEVRIFSQINSESDISKGDSSFVFSKSLGLYSSVQYVKVSELDGSIKKFAGSSDEFIYEQSRCTSGSFYNAFDIYSNKNNGEKFTVLRGTDIVVFYENLSKSKVDFAEAKEEDLKTVAREFLLKIMSEEKFNEYTFVQSDSLLAPPLHAILYVKYVEGYKTDESISIFFDPSGETVMGYNGYNVGKYDTLETNITKKALDEARDALNEKLASMKLENLQTHDPCIITNSEGKVFLEMKFSYDHPDGYAATSSLVTNVI